MPLVQYSVCQVVIRTMSFSRAMSMISFVGTLSRTKTMHSRSTISAVRMTCSLTRPVSSTVLPCT